MPDSDAPGIGHEKDVTLAALVADVMVSTQNRNSKDASRAV